MNEYIVYIAFLIYSCYLIFSIYRDLRSWSNDIRLYGYFPLKVCLLTVQSVYHSTNKFHLLSPLLINVPLAALIIYSPREILPGWIVILPSILYFVIILLHLAEPPSVLLLGNSRWQTVRLMARIERNIFPYRIVTFLDDTSADLLHTNWLNHRKFEINNLRLQGIDNWRRIVFYLLRNVPQIVLDTRVPSPAVVEESKMVISEDLTQKILFIKMDDGTTPSIDSISTNIIFDKSKITTFKPQQVVGELRKRGLKRTKSPNNLPLMTPLVARKISDKVRGASRIIDNFGHAVSFARNEHGDTQFIEEAKDIFTRLVSGPGTLTELDKDMDEIQSFINRWEKDETVWIQSIVAIAKESYQAIGDLQIEIDTAPEDLVDEDRVRLNRFPG